MRINNVSYNTYKKKSIKSQNFNNENLSFGDSSIGLKKSTIFLLGKINVPSVKFTPFEIQTEQYYVNRFFRPQILFADYLFIPEGKSLEKGTYYIKKFVELKGQIKKGAKVIFDNILEASKGSKIQDEIIGRCANIDGEVINTHVQANYVYLGPNSNVQNSKIEAIPKVMYNKKSRKDGTIEEVPSTIAGELNVDGKVKNSELKGYNILVKYDGVVEGGTIIAEENNAIAGQVRNIELIDGNQIHIYSGDGAEVVKSQINIFSKVALYSGGEIKPTPIRCGTICTRSNEQSVAAKQERFED